MNRLLAIFSLIGAFTIAGPTFAQISTPVCELLGNNEIDDLSLRGTEPREDKYETVNLELLGFDSARAKRWCLYYDAPRAELPWAFVGLVKATPEELSKGWLNLVRLVEERRDPRSPPVQIIADGQSRCLGGLFTPDASLSGCVGYVRGEMLIIVAFSSIRTSLPAEALYPKGLKVVFDRVIEKRLQNGS